MPGQSQWPDRPGTQVCWCADEFRVEGIARTPGLLGVGSLDREDSAGVSAHNGGCRSAERSA